MTMKYLVTTLLAIAAGAANATYCSLESPQNCPAGTAPSTSSAAGGPSSATGGTSGATAGAAAGASGVGTGTGTATLTTNTDGSLSIGLPPPVHAAPLPAIRCRGTSRSAAIGWNFISGAGSDTDADGLCQAGDVAAALRASCQDLSAYQVLYSALNAAYPKLQLAVPDGAQNAAGGVCPPPKPAPIVTPGPVPPVPPTPPAPKPEKITLKAGALFDVDSSDLKPEGMIELARLAQRLEPQRIHVVGHTDNTASAVYNEGLSQRRANAVRAYLILRGIDESMITAEGRGLREPIADNRTAGGRQLNRRVVIEASGVAR
jgi:outer membrane protein OmpA-like peptidoglycan-associated protein